MTKHMAKPEGKSIYDPEGTMAASIVFLLGAAYGLLMRLLFGWLPLGGPASDAFPIGGTGPMLASFSMMVPVIVGCLTVALSAPARRSWWFSIWAPWLPTLAFVCGTGLLLIEGAICILMALPLFLLMASVGGLATRLALGLRGGHHGALGALGVLPLLLALPESELPLPQNQRNVSDSVMISAPPEEIWKLINNATDIRPEEMRHGLAYRLGVPLPIEAVTIDTPTGRIRKLKWEDGIAFDEQIVEWHEPKTILWNYEFTVDTFPPDTLDEHVVIGGRHFDLINTRYTLTPESGGTRLAIDVRYRVSTRFNWYANFWGDALLQDTARVILSFYKRRSEATVLGANELDPDSTASHAP